MEITSFDSFEAIRKLAIPHRLPGGFRTIFPLVYQIPENPRQFKIFHIFQTKHPQKTIFDNPIMLLLHYHIILFAKSWKSVRKHQG